MKMYEAAPGHWLLERKGLSVQDEAPSLWVEFKKRFSHI